MPQLNSILKHWAWNLITFDNNRKALRFGNQKINLHKKGEELEPKAETPICGSADLCLITTTDIEEVKSELENKGIEIIEGIVNTAGAIRSIYFRDPDKNLIEASNYFDT